MESCRLTLPPKSASLLVVIAISMQFPLEFIFSTLHIFTGLTDFSAYFVYLKVLIAFSLCVFFVLEFCHFYPVLGKKWLLVMFIFFASFILMILSVNTGLSSVGFSEDSLGRNLFKHYYETLFLYILMFMIGYNLNNSALMYKLFVMFIISMTIIVLPFISLSNFQLDIMRLPYEQRSHYLFMADAFTITLIVVLSHVSKNTLITTVLILFGIIMLYALRSRTALYLFIIGAQFVWFLNGKKWLLTASAIILFATIILFSSFTNLSSLGDPRMITQLVSGEDSSMISRLFQMLIGLQALSQNWLWGDFAGQVRDFGSIGFYMHSYISLWRQFGLLPFVGFCLLLVAIIVRGYTLYKVYDQISPQSQRQVNLFILLSIIIIPAALFARGYGTPYVWLCIGLGCRFILPHNSNSRLISELPRVS